MPTPYSNIYDRLLSKIRRDEDWNQLDDGEVLTDIVQIMNEAIPLFLYPREDLKTRNDVLQEFAAILKDDTENTLTDFMFASWVKRKTADTTVMSQMFHSNDLKFYSQANQLDAMTKFASASLYNAKITESNYYKADD